jgi:hypothetical protein
MSKPLFVETSVGLINLALIRWVKVKAGEVYISFEQTRTGADFIELPRDEWEKIKARMVNEDLLLAR